MRYGTPQVSLYQIPGKLEVRQKNLFSVSDCKMFWQNAGEYLAVKVDRYTKTKKTVYSGFELFRLKERDIPIEVRRYSTIQYCPVLYIAIIVTAVGHYTECIHYQLCVGNGSENKNDKIIDVATVCYYTVLPRVSATQIDAGHAIMFFDGQETRNAVFARGNAWQYGTLLHYTTF